MSHRTRPRHTAKPSEPAGLEGLLTLLERGVHALPFLRGGDDALYLVAVNGRGRAVCNTPVCVPLVGSDEAVAALRMALDAADPVEAEDARMVAELLATTLDRALFAHTDAPTPSRPHPVMGGGRLDGHVC